MSPIIMGPLAWLFVIILTNWLKKAEHFLFVGQKGSGKTTLWTKLNPKINYSPNTREEDINEFTLKRPSGEEITISKSKDIGGEDERFERTLEIIKKDMNLKRSVIYYLIDARKLKELDTGGYLKFFLIKLLAIIKEKKYRRKKEKDIINYSLRFIVTHFSKYCEEQPDKDEEHNKRELQYNLKYVLEKTNTLDKKTIAIYTSDKSLMIGDTNDDEFIRNFKERIGINIK